MTKSTRKVPSGSIRWESGHGRPFAVLRNARAHAHTNSAFISVGQEPVEGDTVTLVASKEGTIEIHPRQLELRLPRDSNGKVITMQMGG